MPQDIPVEASQLLPFTPASLKQIEGAPEFVLRAITEREKLFHRRLIIEAGLETHDTATIRSEFEIGLREMWDEETFEAQMPVIRAYWEAMDDHELQKKDQPELEWSYDADIERAYEELMRKVVKNWPRLREMNADNDQFAQMSFPLLAIVTIKSLTGLDVKRRIDRGYFTLETIFAIRDALAEFEKKNGLVEGLAWMELCTACARRMRLTTEEVGNSGSQSPSQTAPQPSTEMTTSEPDGKSPASESLTETLATE